MSNRPPGPLCSSQLGPNWIDQGTTCLFRSALANPLGVVSHVLAHIPDPFELKFYMDHVYSAAPEAKAKRDLDLKIIGGDFKRGHEVNMDSEAYLKSLISLASGGKRSVGKSKALQFLIIRGGAEGFLPADLSGVDASNVVMTGATTNGAPSTFRFDNNDLLVVFDKSGSLVSSARLERPVFITKMWSQQTANKVYDSWDNKEVFIYKNQSFDIPYLGLGVRDGWRKKHVVVDMHKQEATNGCIFIVDPNTPAIDDANLGAFEPKLITDILAKTGLNIAKVKSSIELGIMRVIEIK